MPDRLDALSKLSVLYIEDDPEVLVDIAVALNMLFHSVHTARTLHEASRIYEECKPSLLIVDIELPDGDGLSWVQGIRQSDQSTPILILTSHSDQEHLLSAIPLGLTDYLIKPVTFERLCNALAKVIKGPHLLGEAPLRLPNGITLNPQSMEIFGLPEKTTLTHQEIRLLILLAKNRGKNVTYAMIDETIYLHDKPLNRRTIRNQINKLRKIVGKEQILSLAEIGYKLV